MQENFENWNKNTKKQNSGVNSKHEFFTQQNKPKRDYDKEPLILRDYRGSALFVNFITIRIFWFCSLMYIFSKISEYKHGYLDIDSVAIYVVIFMLIIIVLLCLNSLKLATSKVTFSYFYASKVEFYDSKNKIENAINFEILDDKILLCSSHNVVSQQYENYIKENGKFTFVSFLHTITKGFGLIFLAILVLLSLFFPSNFLLNIFAIIFITLLAYFLEILALAIIYKKSNGDFKNFWKYNGKFHICIEWLSVNQWKPSEAISMFFFNQKDHDDLREYVLAVFHRDIDENFKYISFQ